MAGQVITVLSWFPWSPSEKIFCVFFHFSSWKRNFHHTLTLDKGSWIVILKPDYIMTPFTKVFKCFTTPSNGLRTTKTWGASLVYQWMYLEVITLCVLTWKFKFYDYGGNEWIHFPSEIQIRDLGIKIPNFKIKIRDLGIKIPNFGNKNPGFWDQNPKFGDQNPKFGNQNPGFEDQEPEIKIRDLGIKTGDLGMNIRNLRINVRD